jgi:hypothetical protein
MNLARGSARNDVPEGSGRVLVYIINEEGTAIRSTLELCGLLGESWTAEAPDLSELEYQLTNVSAAETGAFAVETQTVRFVYKEQ